MPVAPYINDCMASSSFIRKMFEEGIQMKAQYGADKVYDFSIGNPDLEPPEKVKTLLSSLSQSADRGMHAYMPNAGYPKTREAMAAKISGEQGVPVDFSHIIMGTGAAGAMNAVLKSVLSPEDEVIVPSPFFPEYTHYVRNHGGVLKTVQTKSDFSLDTEAIRAALNQKTACVIINSPNNPTGKIYSRQDIANLARVLADHESKTGRTVTLIADEPYREVVYDKREVSPIFPLWPASVIVTSFAKNLSLPGERIGFTAVNPACADARPMVDAIIFSTRILGFVNAPATFQRVVAECWNEPVDYSSYERRRNGLTSILREAGIVYAEPEGAFYLFCRVPPRKDGSGGTTDSQTGDEGAFCEHLKKYRILGVPGKGFGKPGWFRLAYCVSQSSIEASRESFIEACSQW